MIQFTENGQGAWRVQLVGVNGQIVFATEPFASLVNAADAVGLVQELSPHRVSVEHADGRIETSRNVASLKRRAEPAAFGGLLRSMFDSRPAVRTHDADPSAD
jgi:uncharacterized protein YegP (UPF0339 family)